MKIKEDHNQAIGFIQKKDEKYLDKQYLQIKRESKSRASIDEIGVLQEVTIQDATAVLRKHRLIKSIRNILGAGKEATVFSAVDFQDKVLCAKVYNYYTSTNKKRVLATGNPHVKAHHMASLAAKKEYNNLKTMFEAGIPVPEPMKRIDNIILMEYIAISKNSNKVAPLIKDIEFAQFSDPINLLHEAVDILAQLFLRANYIHGDYSEHNLMFTEAGLVTMDVSQSIQYNTNTLTDTPKRINLKKALDFLYTDIYNINKFFHKKYRIQLTIDEVITNIHNKLPQNLKSMIETDNIDFKTNIMEKDRYVRQQSSSLFMSEPSYNIKDLRDRYLDK